MKILIITQSFYPEIAPRSLRTTDLAKGVAAEGHEVVVMTVYHEELAAFAKDFKIRLKFFPKLKYKNISTEGRFSLVKRGVRRGMQLLFEYPEIELRQVVKRMINKETEKYDAIISIAVPHSIHWGVSASNWKRIAKTWIADCGDPFMGLTNDSFNKMFYFKYFEKKFCRQVDFITVPIADARKGYYPEFEDKIKVIPQGFYFPEYQEREEPENKTISFGYSGTIGSYRSYAIPFLNFLNSIDTDFKFVIYTREPFFYKEILDEKTKNKCSFREYVPRFELIDELMKLDFLIYFPYVESIQKPLKLIDYYYTKKPIIEFRNDTNSKKIFLEFLNRNYVNAIESEPVEPYRIENVLQSFIELIISKKN